MTYWTMKAACGASNGGAHCDRNPGHSGAHSARVGNARMTWTNFGLAKAKALAAFTIDGLHDLSGSLLRAEATGW